MLETDELDYFEDMLHGSRIKQDIYKTGSTYKENSNAELWVEGIMMGKLSSDTVITPEPVEKISVTEGVLTMEEMEDLYNKTENKINPAQQMQLMWYSDNFDTQIDLTRKNGKSDWDSQPYTIIEDRVYLPLRYIGETFGEELDLIFNQADLFVLPGTGGLAVQQAMAHALPVIVAEGDGTQSDLVTYENGWNIAPNDPQALMDAISSALSSPESLRQKGLAAYQTVKTIVNIDQMVSIFIQASMDAYTRKNWQ